MGWRTIIDGLLSVQVEKDELDKEYIESCDFIIEYSTELEWKFMGLQIKAEQDYPGSFHNFEFPLKIYREKIKK